MHVCDGYDVGDIVCNHWGYDQTNIDFYRIVGRTPGGNVWLQPLEALHSAEIGFMTTRVMPGDEKPEKRIRRKLHYRDGQIIGLAIASYGWCKTWDGQPETATHYA